jgi:hypothetical protein
MNLKSIILFVISEYCLSLQEKKIALRVIDIQSVSYSEVQEAHMLEFVKWESFYKLPEM